MRRAERWPRDDFPVQAARDTGLPAWTEAGVVSFWLKPYAFSGRNPSHDVPPSHHH